MGYVASAMSDARHLAKGEFAPVFASGLLGMMVGAIIFGPLADMFGGRRMILCCFVGFPSFIIRLRKSACLGLVPAGGGQCLPATFKR